MHNGSLVPTPGVCTVISGSAGTSTPPIGGTGTTTPNGGDTEAPILSVNGNSPATIFVGDSYIDLGVVVTDNVDQNLGYITFIDGTSTPMISIDTSVAGTHIFTYEATDQAGNTGTAERTVMVEEIVTTPLATDTGTTTDPLP
jgi:hypothetical protein